jgi:hypothetical protein
VGVEENPGPPKGMKGKGKSTTKPLPRSVAEALQDNPEPNRPEDCKAREVLRPPGPPEKGWSQAPGPNNASWIHDSLLITRKERLEFEQVTEKLWDQHVQEVESFYEEQIKLLPPIYFGWCTLNPEKSVKTLLQGSMQDTHLPVDIQDSLTGIQDVSQMEDKQKEWCYGLTEEISHRHIDLFRYKVARSIDSVVQNSNWGSMCKTICKMALNNTCEKSVGRTAMNFWRVKLKITGTSGSTDKRKPSNRTVTKTFDEILCDVEFEWCGSVIKRNCFQVRSLKDTDEQDHRCYTPVYLVEKYKGVRLLSAMDSFVSNPYMTMKEVTCQSHANLNRLSTANSGWMRFNTGPEHRLMTYMAASLESYKNSLN